MDLQLKQYAERVRWLLIVRWVGFVLGPIGFLYEIFRTGNVLSTEAQTALFFVFLVAGINAVFTIGFFYGRQTLQRLRLLVGTIIAFDAVLLNAVILSEGAIEGPFIFLPLPIFIAAIFFERRRLYLFFLYVLVLYYGAVFLDYAGLAVPRFGVTAEHTLQFILPRLVFNTFILLLYAFVADFFSTMLWRRSNELEKANEQLVLQSRELEIEANELQARTLELEKTKSDLEKKYTELERLNATMTGRELKIIELKEELKKAQAAKAKTKPQQG